MNDFTFQGRILGTGYYLTSTDLPSFRLFIDAKDMDNYVEIIQAALEEFLPVYEAMEARKRVRGMQFERRQVHGIGAERENIEILAHFEAA